MGLHPLGVPSRSTPFHPKERGTAGEQLILGLLARTRESLLRSPLTAKERLSRLGTHLGTQEARRMILRASDLVAGVGSGGRI